MEDKRNNNDAGGCLTIVIGVILFLFLWIFVLSTPAYTATCVHGVLVDIFTNLLHIW